MLHALALLAVTAETEDEPVKTAFYVCGGLLAAWAVVLAMVGMSRATFPQTEGAARGVMAISFVLVVAAAATAVITA
ncbi:MAG TPA: hypothetical protein VFT50_06590 [Baekduia sp.]|nr:hypothetical protein [Baekduia sp.]